jgi:plasmid replication initiation protein
MNQSISRFLGRLAKSFEGEETQEISLRKPKVKEIEQDSISNLENEEKPPIIEQKKQDEKQTRKKIDTRRKKPREGETVTIDPRDIRDIIELMEFPFLALSKNRTAPIVYENSDGSVKVRISGHPPHYVASVYDWDIILFVASKMQEIINFQSDIPPRTLIVPRYELLKALHKHDGKKEEKDLKASLSRLKLTGIETTIRNEDGRYDAGFGFLDSWGYTDRKDVREFRITLSQWLYDGICRKGSLLKVRPEYFKITSGFKKFLYRTARKHVGIQNDSWTFPIESLYKKSGSEQEFKKFKYKLKKAVEDNDIPAYSMKWIEEDGKEKVLFISKKKEIEKILSKS